MTDQTAPEAPAAMPARALAMPRFVCGVNSLYIVGIIVLTLANIAVPAFTTIPIAAVTAVTTPVIMSLFALLRNDGPAAS